MKGKAGTGPLPTSSSDLNTVAPCEGHYENLRNLHPLPFRGILRRLLACAVVCGALSVLARLVALPVRIKHRQFRFELAVHNFSSLPIFPALEKGPACSPRHDGVSGPSFPCARTDPTILLASVPEAVRRQPQRFQFFLHSSSSPFKESSRWPDLQSLRYRR